MGHWNVGPQAGTGVPNSATCSCASYDAGREAMMAFAIFYSVSNMNMQKTLQLSLTASTAAPNTMVLIINKYIM